MSEVLERYNEWPPAIQKAFVQLLSATSVPLAYFKNEVDMTAERRKTDSHLTMDVTSIKAAHKYDNSDIIASHTATSLDERRISQLHAQMSIQITLINTADHPSYKMQLSSKDNLYNVEQNMRFFHYRDFHQEVMEKCSLKMVSEFPETKKRSSLGLKLNDEELDDRAAKLDKVRIRYMW